MLFCVTPPHLVLSICYSPVSTYYYITSLMNPTWVSMIFTRDCAYNNVFWLWRGIARCAMPATYASVIRFLYTGDSGIISYRAAMYYTQRCPSWRRHSGGGLFVALFAGHCQASSRRWQRRQCAGRHEGVYWKGRLENKGTTSLAPRWCSLTSAPGSSVFSLSRGTRAGCGTARMTTRAPGCTGRALPHSTRRLYRIHFTCAPATSAFCRLRISRSLASIPDTWVLRCVLLRVGR